MDSLLQLPGLTDNRSKHASLEASIERPRFSPYADNGGNVVAIGGEDFVCIASDTRLSTGFHIFTRTQPKLFKLTPTTVLGCAGCWCDILTFSRVIEARLKMYGYEHNKTMSTSASAQLVSTMLYYKRFFPYYISNVVAGIDQDGQGVVYGYDPVGHMEKLKYEVAGSSSALMTSFLDSKLGLKTAESFSKVKQISREEAIQVIHDAFVSAAERDIYCGDGVVIQTITRDGVEEKFFPLRKD